MWNSLSFAMLLSLLDGPIVAESALLGNGGKLDCEAHLSYSRQSGTPGREETMKRLGFLLALIFIPYVFTSVCMGQVTNTLPNGGKYIGGWKDGQPNGQG